MPSTEQPPPRRIANHRRTRPDLNINTIHANDADSPLDSGLQTPLSPPPPPAPLLQSPAIPTKSSQRSLKTFPHEKRTPDRNARHRPDRERPRDRDLGRPKDAEMESFLDFDSTSSPIDASNKENAFPSFADPRSRRQSTTPPPRHANLRDSHDLSLSPRNVTRDSLLGNMLLSLDQFSMDQMSGAPGMGAGAARTMSGFGDPSSFRYYEQEDEGTRTMTSTARPPPSRGTRHGYSYSSDYEGADDSSHMSGGYTRGTRSNSSSTGYQSNLGRINSMREPTSNQRSFPHAPGPSRPLHTRGGRGSKSSSTNSIDPGYAQVLGSQRWAHGLGGPKRSSSFDMACRPSLSADDHQNQPPPQRQQQQPWHIEFSNSFFAPANNNNITTTTLSSPFDYDVDDAAPTPTVPVGPRRLGPMPSMPSFPRPEPMGEPLSPVRSVNVNLERRRSNKSSRSTNTAATRHSHHSSSRFNNNGRDKAPPPPLPGPVPDLLVDSAPAPHVGYEKAKEPVHAATPTSVVSQPPRDKPGFFRRMFGGSKNSVVAALDQSAASPSLTNSTLASPATTTAATTITMNTGSASSPHSSFATPPPPNPPSRQTSSSHGLQKKPSGFFRRRKKSVSVNNVDPPPLPSSRPPPILPPAELPLELSPRRLDLLTPRPEPSPVTSLRKAMDPYLTGSSTSSGIVSPAYISSNLASSGHHTSDEIQPPYVRGFSPDYEPDPKATIRSVSSESRLDVDNRRHYGADSRRPSTPTNDPFKLPYAYERAGSFLHDNSDSEDSPPRVTASASQPTMGASHSRPLSPSATARNTLLAPIQTDLPLASPTSQTTIRDKKLDRLTQDSMSSDMTDRPSSLTLPIEGVRTDLKTRSSTASIPNLTIEESEPNSKVTTPKAEHPLDEPEFVVGDPTEDDRAKAQKMFDLNEDFIPKEKAASWMGEEGPIRQRTLRAYMDLYDFANKSVVTSLRDVCNRLILRAETQQVDRVLVAFSRRWCDCNPNHGFKSTGTSLRYCYYIPKLTNADVIHTICYSIMLLNTDLHLADIESKMTRSQFIKNTMTTIRQAVAESVPDAFHRPSILPGKGLDGRTSGEHDRTSFRNSFVRLPLRAGSALGDAPTDLDDCGPLVKAPFEGSLKAWESQMEQVLKDIYASIKDDRLPLYGAEPAPETAHHSTGGLSVMNMLKRSPSVLSKAPSENPSTRGRGPDSIRASNSRWASKSRSRPRGFGSAGFSSSRTSFDDGQSMWSPVESTATWSRASLGRTHTTMSIDSFGSRYPRGDYQQSIGFANALSQAIIREDVFGSAPSLVSDELKTTQLLEDESLELAGPPWIKEGIVYHKHHLDGVEKKAKDRNWSEVFAVVQKGSMSIFSFAANKLTGRHKGRNAQKKGGVVGGGNWQENATTLATWNLRLTMASVLPHPGYSKQRQHVWALSLPTGAVHLFHVGTPEICTEFVTTVNYWSARLSTHPLIGGVSNMEYGWSDAIINNALVTAIKDSTGGASTVAGTMSPPGTGRQRSGSIAGRTSISHSRTSSFRSVSSFDFGSTNPRTGGHGLPSNKLPGDIVTICEWMPPTQSMRPAKGTEKEQLEVLSNYVKSIEDELQQHNALRSPMLLAFTPRGANAQKAMANWERKSQYLLREIGKFRIYVEALQLADGRKKEIWKERDIARRAARGSLDGVSLEEGGDDGERDVGDDDEGDLTLKPGPG